MRSAVATTVLVCLALSLSVSAAQRTSQDLQGRLTVKNGGAAPPFVWLRLEELGGATIRETIANDREFALPGLEPGRYTIVAEAPGFEKARVDIDFPFDRFVTIELKPSRQEPSRAEVAPLSDLRIPKSARRQFAAAKKKVEENRCQDAFDDLRRAIRIYAGYGDAHRAMGECYAEMNQPEAAEEEFKQALEQIHRPDLHLKLATIYAQRDDVNQTLRQIEYYVAEGPRNALRDRMQSLLERYGESLRDSKRTQP